MGQAGPQDFTGLSGGHSLKFNVPVGAKLHYFGAKFGLKTIQVSCRMMNFGSIDVFWPYTVPC